MKKDSEMFSTFEWVGIWFLIFLAIVCVGLSIFFAVLATHGACV